MEFLHTTVKIGLEKPFSVLHMSDTHLACADLRDGERKVALAERRQPHFAKAMDMVEQATCYAAEKSLPILHTGDLLDFVSVANLEVAARFAAQADLFLAAGNHEFSLYVGEAKEDAAYREQSLAKVQAAFKNDIRASSRVIGGVNFVALDNGYYSFDESQYAFLKKEVEKGLPVVLLLHVPLYEHALYERMMSGSTSAYLLAVPEPLTQCYEGRRVEQQLADGITREAVAFIEECGAIKAILAGHLHFSYEGVVAGRIPQILTSGTRLREIRFV